MRNALTYKDYGFAPAPVSGGTADRSANLDADGPYLSGDGGCGCAGSSALLGGVASATPIRADRFASASMGAARSVAAKSCQVTTPASRTTGTALVTRGAVAGVRTSDNDYVVAKTWARRRARRLGNDGVGGRWCHSEQLADVGDRDLAVAPASRP